MNKKFELELKIKQLQEELKSLNGTNEEEKQVLAEDTSKEFDKFYNSFMNKFESKFGEKAYICINAVCYLKSNHEELWDL